MQTPDQRAVASQIEVLVFDALTSALQAAAMMALEGIARLKRGGVSAIIDIVGDEMDAMELWAVINSNDTPRALELYATRILYQKEFAKERQALKVVAEFMRSADNPFNIANAAFASAREKARKAA